MRGPHGQELPGSVLFACTENAIRSPMAAALARHLLGRFIYVRSAGVRAGELDPLAVEVMEELGIEIVTHKPRTFEDLEDGSFDLVVTLSPEAQHRAVELTRTSAVEIEYWPITDPTAIEGSREQKLVAYRAVRDELLRRIKDRFDTRPSADT